MAPKDSLYPKDWFRLSARDWKRAEQLVNLDDPEGAGYHLQQAEEVQESIIEAEQLIQLLKGSIK